eukprot:Opistho-2@83761
MSSSSGKDRPHSAATSLGDASLGLRSNGNRRLQRDREPPSSLTTGSNVGVGDKTSVRHVDIPASPRGRMGSDHGAHSQFSSSGLVGLRPADSRDTHRERERERELHDTPSARLGVSDMSLEELSPPHSHGTARARTMKDAGSGPAFSRSSQASSAGALSMSG